MVSGLHVASAILTKYKGPEDEKAVLRPYTPISDESMFLVVEFSPSLPSANFCLFLSILPCTD